ncbi:MAG: hypothetical protein R2873_33540 [Caldilineaceae bacterium]
MALSAPDVVALETAVAAQASAVDGAIAATGRQQGIQFSNVHFTYPGRDAPVYAGLDLRGSMRGAHWLSSA